MFFLKLLLFLIIYFFTILDIYCNFYINEIFPNTIDDTTLEYFSIKNNSS
ncbi:MAG: hypothetical protein P1U46_02825 [Patescibacteria group bacterium]|nr:hypothetical protein [Patescibacteria group bacterium]